MAGGVVLLGIKEIDRKLKRLDAKFGKKVVRKALRTGAKMVADEARRQAPVDSGTLRSAIKVKAQKRSRKSIGINVIVGEGFFIGKTFYAGFIEFGAPGHKMFGKGRAPLDAAPFMRPAYDRTKNQARDRVLQQILAGLNLEVTRG